MRTYTAIALIALLAVSNAQTASIAVYDTLLKCTGPTASTGVTKNLLQAAVADGYANDACENVSAKRFKLSFTSSAVSLFSSYGTAADCTGTATVIADATASTWNYDTCFEMKIDSVYASATVGTTKPAYKFTYVTGTTPKVKITAYDSLADCSTTVAASTDATKNLLYSIKDVKLPVSATSCTQIGTATKYAALVAPSSTSITSFKTYDAAGCSGTGTNIATSGATLEFAKCITQATNTENSGVTTSTAGATSPSFKLTYNAADATTAKTSAMNMSVGIAALFALLIAALF